ncbi:MAG TPA: amidohydrolase family protein [Thermoanaerobaculia bacterium]|nr:amidohydrolase family protein [Thermoanaerobaculia bacterium]
MSRSRTLFALSVLAASLAGAQAPAPAAAPPPADDPAKLSFMEYDPPSTLVVAAHPVKRAKYPFVDVHSHQFNLDETKLRDVVAAMDAMNLAVLVNLSGRGFRRIETPGGMTRFALNDPGYLRELIALGERIAPGRIVHFTNVDFYGVGSGDWAQRAVAQLEADVAAGARGLKIYKSLGMDTTDVDGRRLAVDDPRLDPIWETCARRGLPVLIHTADPAPFWQPKTKDNERLYELIETGRYRDPAENVAWEQLIAEQHNLFRRHPRTQFVNAHLGWLGNDLGRLGRLLDEAPNVTTEIGAVLAELGRQPRFAREWLIRYQDRVMFGKDSWAPAEYPPYFRVLETADDYFPYYRRRHAFWRLYGLDLPDEVLRKLYFENALRVVPGLDRERFGR